MNRYILILCFALLHIELRQFTSLCLYIYIFMKNITFASIEVSMLTRQIFILRIIGITFKINPSAFSFSFIKIFEIYSSRDFAFGFSLSYYAAISKWSPLIVQSLFLSINFFAEFLIKYIIPKSKSLLKTNILCNF